MGVDDLSVSNAHIDHGIAVRVRGKLDEHGIGEEYVNSKQGSCLGGEQVSLRVICSVESSSGY